MHDVGWAFAMPASEQGDIVVSHWNAHWPGEEALDRAQALAPVLGDLSIVSNPGSMFRPVLRSDRMPPDMRAFDLGPVGIVTRLRRRSMRRLETLRVQNALEQDRTRIARDLHDDLGTRVTVLTMTAALARRDLDTDPAKTRRHLEAMAGSARELVAAMDDLVWAVDPAHDTLDHLASHLTRLAEEMFRDSPVRCRLDIPALLPARPLGADFRHHLALAVKESLHNVLRHAGPCEVFLSLKFDGETLTLVIRDTGRGFDPDAPPEGHGLSNTPARIREIGGSYAIDSAPGRGTSIVIRCRIPDLPA
jgi:signal transduction histidine kinase